MVYNHLFYFYTLNEVNLIITKNTLYEIDLFAWL